MKEDDIKEVPVVWTGRRTTAISFASTIGNSIGYEEGLPVLDSKKYTALVVPGKGLFQFKTMPIGLHNAPETLERFNLDRVRVLLSKSKPNAI